MFLFGCGGKTYNVDYHGQMNMFNGARETYKAGKHVKLVFDLIATDTDYTFICTGDNFKTDYKNGYVLEFDMPDHDIEMYYESVNTMMHVPVPLKCQTLTNIKDVEAVDGAVVIKPEQIMDGCLELTIFNKTSEVFSYGSMFELQKNSESGYVNIVPEEEISWTMELYELNPGDEVTITRNLNVYGEVETGDYKIIINGVEAEFTVVEYWTE